MGAKLIKILIINKLSFTSLNIVNAKDGEDVRFHVRMIPDVTTMTVEIFRPVRIK